MLQHFGHHHTIEEPIRPRNFLTIATLRTSGLSQLVLDLLHRDVLSLHTHATTANSPSIPTTVPTATAKILVESSVHNNITTTDDTGTDTGAAATSEKRL